MFCRCGVRRGAVARSGEFSWPDYWATERSAAYASGKRRTAHPGPFRRRSHKEQEPPSAVGAYAGPVRQLAARSVASLHKALK